MVAVAVEVASCGGVTLLGGWREAVPAVDSFVWLPLHRSILRKLRFLIEAILVV